MAETKNDELIERIRALLANHTPCLNRGGCEVAYEINAEIAAWNQRHTPPAAPAGSSQVILDNSPAASGMGFEEWLQSHEKYVDLCPVKDSHTDQCMEMAFDAGTRSTAAFVGVCVRCDAAITREEATRSTAGEGRTFDKLNAELVDDMPAWKRRYDLRVSSHNADEPADEPSSPPTEREIAHKGEES